MRTIALIALTLAIVGCSQAERSLTSKSTESGATPSAVSPEMYKSPQGVSYTVERVPGFHLDGLPMNSDLKLADGDLAKYAENLCTLDVPPATAPKRCDIYVQSDPAGTLIGYVAVIQDANGVSFQTATTINEKKQADGGRCYLGGAISGSGANWKDPIRDAGRDFSGQFAYMAWEKDPGNWIITPMDDEEQGGSPENASGGVWYLEKRGDKLHIYQERWNYCYRDSSINVDDVFYRAVTLNRM